MTNHDDNENIRLATEQILLVFHWARLERRKSHKMSLPYKDLLWCPTFWVLYIYIQRHSQINQKSRTRIQFILHINNQLYYKTGRV